AEPIPLRLLKLLLDRFYRLARLCIFLELGELFMDVIELADRHISLIRSDVRVRILALLRRSRPFLLGQLRLRPAPGSFHFLLVLDLSASVFLAVRRSVPRR